MNILSFLLAHIQMWWYHWHIPSNGGSTTTSSYKPVIGGTATPAGPFVAVGSASQLQDPLSDLLDKYKELPKNDRPRVEIPQTFVYVETTTRQDRLVKRLHKLLNRYGFHLEGIEYKVKHDADDQYKEDLVLTIHRLHKINQVTIP
jgi:hypothetical protein